MYLVTVQSVITALLGTRQRWQAMNRTGAFTTPGQTMDGPPQARLAR
jgi:hypothetical protein